MPLWKACCKINYVPGKEMKYGNHKDGSKCESKTEETCGVKTDGCNWEGGNWEGGDGGNWEGGDGGNWEGGDGGNWEGGDGGNWEGGDGGNWEGGDWEGGDGGNWEGGDGGNWEGGDGGNLGNNTLIRSPNDENNFTSMEASCEPTCRPAKDFFNDKSETLGVVNNIDELTKRCLNNTIDKYKDSKNLYDKEIDQSNFDKIKDNVNMPLWKACCKINYVPGKEMKYGNHKDGSKCESKTEETCGVKTDGCNWESGDGGNWEGGDGGNWEGGDGGNWEGGDGGNWEGGTIQQRTEDVLFDDFTSYQCANEYIKAKSGRKDGYYGAHGYKHEDNKCTIRYVTVENLNAPPGFTSENELKCFNTCESNGNCEKYVYNNENKTCQIFYLPFGSPKIPDEFNKDKDEILKCENNGFRSENNIVNCNERVVCKKNQNISKDGRTCEDVTCTAPKVMIKDDNNIKYCSDLKCGFGNGRYETWDGTFECAPCKNGFYNDGGTRHCIRHTTSCQVQKTNDIAERIERKFIDSQYQIKTNKINNLTNEERESLKNKCPDGWNYKTFGCERSIPELECKGKNLKWENNSCKNTTKNDYAIERCELIEDNLAAPVNHFCNLSKTENSKCVRCPNGTFINTDKNVHYYSQCKQKNDLNCPDGEYRINSDNFYEDNICRSCPDNTFKKGTNKITKCLPLYEDNKANHTCSKGEKVVLIDPNNDKKGWTCQTCKLDEYQDQENHSATKCKSKNLNRYCGSGKTVIVGNKKQDTYCSFPGILISQNEIDKIVKENRVNKGEQQLIKIIFYAYRDIYLNLPSTKKYIAKKNYF